MNIGDTVSMCRRVFLENEYRGPSPLDELKSRIEKGKLESEGYVLSETEYFRQDGEIDVKAPWLMFYNSCLKFTVVGRKAA